MAVTFQNIVWNDNDSIDGYKFSKMVENDNLNYALVSKSSKGFLAGVNIADVSSANRSFKSDVSPFTVAANLATVNVYNKNLPLQEKNGQLIKRYYKVCISDMTVRMRNVSSSTGNPTTNNTVDGSGTSIFTQRPRGFMIRALLNGEPVVDFLSTLRPGRRSASPETSTAFWRSQAGEFLIPLEYITAYDFVLKFELFNAVLETSPTLHFQLENGSIWIEDAGGEGI
jgi:hypothetical protein